MRTAGASAPAVFAERSKSVEGFLLKGIEKSGILWYFNKNNHEFGVERMLKLLIAEGTEAFRLVLADNLKELYQVRVCQEGKEALEAMRSFRPDLLVLDLMLPGLDGITVLQRAAEAGVEPVVLATTPLINDYIAEIASRMKVSFLMVKPCDVQAATARLLDLTERLKEPVLTRPDYRTEVSNLLLSLGIATNLRGFSYLRDAILAEIRQPGQQLTKVLYPDVGKPYGASGAQVERSIRDAVGKAWLRRNDALWGQYFPTDAGGRIPKPSNAVFICTLANYITGGCSKTRRSCVG